MKTPTNIGGNNLALWLTTATEIRMADLYTITLKNATVLRYTTWDSNLVISGNLLAFSERFDQWAGNIANGVALPTVTPNNQTDPLNGTTADTISCPATIAGQWSLVGQTFLNLASVAGQTFTFSIWLKAASAVTVSILVEDGGGNTAIFVNQAITTSWQRYTFTGTYPALGVLIGAPYVFIGLDGAFPATTFYAWGAQLTQSSIPAAYVPTGSTPLASVTFLTGPPNIDRTAIEEKLGIEVSTIDVTIQASLTDLLNGVPILQAMGMGLFEGAAFKIERLFMDATGQQIGTVVRFAGFIGAVDELTRGSAKIQVESGTKLLQMDLPAILLQPGCTNTLFDARCTLAKFNQLKFSEQFDNAVWGLNDGATVTPNNATDPLGGSTADTVTEGSGPHIHLLDIGQSIALNAAGKPWTFSIWMKVASGSQTIMLGLSDAVTVSNALNVSVTTTWTRFAITASNLTNTGQILFGINIAAPGNPTGTTVQAWGAQLEFGSVATPYVSTAGSAGFAEWNTVQGGSTVNKLISLSAKTDNYFDNGQIVFISGPNAGLVKAVKTNFSQQFTFNSPLPFLPNAGDNFIAYPGCDKMQTTCTTKFNNLVNFEGMPYVPVPETAI